MGIWRNFNEFFIRLDRKLDNWEDRLTLFAAHLINENKKSNTVKSYVSAIKAVLTEIKVEVKEDACLLRALTRACRLHKDVVHIRQPLQKDILQPLLNTVQKHFSELGQIYQMHLYMALFSTTYFGLFRIGEVTESPHVVKACDVKRGVNKRKIQFTLRSSKTHGKDSYPQKVKISSSSRFRNTTFCPYELLDNYIACRPTRSSKDEQFFVFRDNSPVTPANFQNTFKSMFMLAGYDATLFSAHSLRAGRSLDLLSLGLSVETIKKLGRWKSNAVYNYLR